MRQGVRVGRWAAMAAAAVIVTVAACRGGDGATSRSPNVVVVLVDDLRWDDIGVAGHPFVQTPAIDRLAREGTRFLNAFATTPLCSPSRAAILTGQYVHTNGIIDNTARDAASHRLPTFAMPLAERRLPTGVLRQVAHGQRRHAAARVDAAGWR